MISFFVFDFFIGVSAGIFATWIMDTSAFFIIRRQWVQLSGLQIVPTYLGRWIIGIFQFRKFCVVDIRTIPESAKEKRVGMISHYAIGALLGIIFFVICTVVAIPKSLLLPAGLVYGFTTNIFPWAWMYPAMGFGFIAMKLPMQLQILKFSFINHLIYGLALGFATWVVSI